MLLTFYLGKISALSLHGRAHSIAPFSPLQALPPGTDPREVALTRTAPALTLAPTPSEPNRMDSLRGVALWGALGVAFSPILFAGSQSADPGSKYSYLLLIAGVLATALWRERHNARLAPAKHGVLVIGLGIALELTGILGETQFLTLLAIPVACLGLALLRGWPSLGAACLAFFLVPIPDAILGLASPSLEMGLARFGAAILGVFGGGLGNDPALSLHAVGLSLIAGDAKLDLRPGNGGFLLAHLLAALGFVRSISNGAGIAASMRSAALFGASAFILQPLGVGIAGAMVALGNVPLARLWLTHGVSCAAALGVHPIHLHAARKKRARRAD